MCFGFGGLEGGLIAFEKVCKICDKQDIYERVDKGGFRMFADDGHEGIVKGVGEEEIEECAD